MFSTVISSRAIIRGDPLIRAKYQAMVIPVQIVQRTHQGYFRRVPFRTIPKSLCPPFDVVRNLGRCVSICRILNKQCYSKRLSTNHVQECINDNNHSFGHSSTSDSAVGGAPAHSHAQSNSNLQSTALNMHKQERDAVRAPALTWSNSLATGAQSWAEHLAALNQGKPLDTIRKSDLVHSTTTLGENLAQPPHGELGRFLLLRRSP